MGGAIVLVVPLLLSLAGWIPPIRLSSGSPKDAQLVEIVLFHAGLGLLLFAVHLALGAGLVLVVVRSRAVPLCRLVLFGYPLAIVWEAAASVATLALPWGGLVGPTLLLVGLAPLCWWRGDRTDLANATRTIVQSLPFAVVFALLLGIPWHGPTDTLAARAMGDHVFYSASTRAYALSLWPIPHLGVAGEHLSYFALMPTLVGAALGRVPGFDPFLFFATSVPVLCVLSTTLGLALLPAALHPGTRLPALSSGCALVCGLLVAGASQFPAWLVGSPTVALTLPLVPSVYALALANGFRGASAATLTSIFGTLLTKTTAAPALVAFAVSHLVIQVRRRRDRVGMLVLLALGGLAVAGTIALAFRFGPTYARIARLGPLSWQYRADFTPWMLRDAGLLLLGVGMLGTRPRATALAVGLAVANCWVAPFVFEVGSLVAAGLVACVLVSGSPPVWTRRLAAASALLLTAGAMATEPSGPWAGLCQLLLMALPCWLALGPHLSPLRRVVPACVMVVGLAATWALAAGTLVIDSSLPGELTPAVRDIWRAVRERTPRNALIFTDQTGLGISLVGGWNTYSFFGERQVFVASVLQSRYRYDVAAARGRLRQNKMILGGRVTPAEVPDAAGFGSAFAVMVNARRPGPGFRLCYRNPAYSLYAIPWTRRAEPPGCGS